jgi:hypothetical protein
MFHTCCKNMFQWFQLFQSYVAVSVFMLQVASVLSEYCIYFTHIFQARIYIYIYIYIYIVLLLYIAFAEETIIKKLIKIECWLWHCDSLCMLAIGRTLACISIMHDACHDIYNPKQQ